MKTLLSVMLLLVSGCAAGVAPSSLETTEAEQSATPTVVDVSEAQRVLKLFYAGKTKTLWPRFSPQFRALVGSEGAIKEMAESIQRDLGGELEVVAEQSRANAGGIDYRRDVRYRRGESVFSVVISIDKSGVITTLGILPATPEAPSKYLDRTSKVHLRLPFDGEWTTAWGGRKTFDNYHAAAVDQRFAYDFLIERDGTTHRNTGRSNSDYFCYGTPILAPAAGTVVVAVDGVAENKPGEMNPKAPAGNNVVLDHGNAEFSFLAHLQPGSLRVKVGDKVSSGTTLGLCGNSGNSSEPHLHYHLQDTSVLFKGAGIPAWFHDVTLDGKAVERAEPVRGQIVQQRTGGQS